MESWKKMVILYISFILVNGDRICERKYVSGQDSFLCVCNHKDCPTLPKLDFKSIGENVISYESDQKNSRFHKTIVNLTSKIRSSASATIAVYVAETSQKIIGFGGAFTDATGINIRKLSFELQSRLLKDYFDDDGLKYNIGRVPIAGSDFSTRNYSYDDSVGDIELKNFSLTYDDYYHKIPFIRQAMKLSKTLKLVGSIWSPPAWMKTSKNLKGIGILIGEPGTLYWKIFSQYHVRFLQEYEKFGIDFWALTTGNEPSNGLNPGWKFNCLGMSPHMMRDLIKIDLGPTLEAAGYGSEKIKLMVFDDTLSKMAYYLDVVMADPNAAKYISGIAYHWYDFPRFPYDVLQVAHEKYPQKFFMMTEACEGYSGTLSGVTPGNWSRAENYAQDILEGLNRGSSGWIDWNMALDLEGGPNWSENFVDSPILVNETGQEYYRQPTYYALSHFTKFLSPGSVRIRIALKSGPCISQKAIVLWIAKDPAKDHEVAKISRPALFFKYLINNEEHLGKINGHRGVAKAIVFLKIHAERSDSYGVNWTPVFLELYAQNLVGISVKRLAGLHSLIWWLYRNTGDGSPVDSSYQLRLIAFILQNKVQIYDYLKRRKKFLLTKFIKRISYIVETWRLNWDYIISYLIRKRRLYVV